MQTSSPDKRSCEDHPQTLTETWTCANLTGPFSEFISCISYYALLIYIKTAFFYTKICKPLFQFLIDLFHFGELLMPEHEFGTVSESGLEYLLKDLK